MRSIVACAAGLRSRVATRCLRGHSLPAGLSRRSGALVVVMADRRGVNLAQSCPLSVRIVRVDVLGAVLVVVVGTRCQ